MVTFGSNTMELTGFGSSSDMSFGPIIDQCLRPMAWLRPVKMTATVNSSLLTVRLRRAQLRPNIARDELQPSRQPLRHMCSKFYQKCCGLGSIPKTWRFGGTVINQTNHFALLVRSASYLFIKQYLAYMVSPMRKIIFYWLSFLYRLVWTKK